MRESLIPLNGQRFTIRAGVTERGKRLGWANVMEPTVCLGPVTTMDGTVLADHVWLVVGKRLKRIHPHVGDTLELSVRVKPYRKHFYRHPGKKARYQVDLKFAYPTKVRAIARASTGRSVTP